MSTNFLPDSAKKIHESGAIALLEQMQRRIVHAPFESGSTEVVTAYVRRSPAPLTLKSNVSPILLLHGFDSSLLEFRRLFPLLAERNDTWAIDLYGSGFTQYDVDVAVNAPNIRQHLLGVLQDWIGQPVTLVGASLGGAVAIDFALHHPEWVRSLVLIDSVGFSGDFPVGQYLGESLIELGADWLYFRKHAALVAASPLEAINPTLVNDLRCSLLHQEMLGWKAAIVSFTRSGGYAGLDRQITKILQPTLILWGEADDVLGKTDATLFERAIEGSQLTVIPQAGHTPHLDQPAQSAAHLLNFVQ
jgi:pimeloyl-ACP methyl ester carboxylesterase